MYCSKCGKSIPDDAKFCTTCGFSLGAAYSCAQINAQVTETELSNRKESRESELNTVGALITRFSEKRGEYAEYDSLFIKIGESVAPVSSVRQILGIIFTVIGAPLVLSLSTSFVSFFMNLNPTGYKNNYNSLVPIVVGIIIGAPLLVIGLSLLLSYVARVKNSKNTLRKTYPRLIELTNDLHKFYFSSGYCPVGQDNSNPEALKKIYQIIQSGRADTIKEALGVLSIDANAVNNNLVAVNAQRAYNYLRSQNINEFYTSFSYFIKIN